MTTEESTEATEETVTTETSETAAVDGDIENDVITKDAEVTQQMLHDKFVSECGSDFIFVDETFMDINGVPSAIIKVEDPSKTTVDTYLVTMDNVKLLNSVVKGGMGSAATYKSFTCDGQEFLAEFVKTMSDTGFISYITIYKCENNGSLNATNIKGEQIHLAAYRDVGNGTFDWVGDRNITVDQCISNDSNSITLKYENNRENTSKTVVYEYDKSTNSFVEPGSKPVTPENPDENDTTSANVTIGDKKFIIKIQSGEVQGDYYPVKMYLSIYFEDGTATNLQNIIVNEGVTFGEADHHNAYNVNNYFSITNNIITIQSKVAGDTNYFFDKVTNKFVEATSIPEPPDEAIDIHEKDILTVTGTLKFVETGNGLNTVKQPVIKLDKPINVLYHVTGTNSAVIDGQTETLTEIQFIQPQNFNYTEGQKLSVTGKVFFAHTAYHATNIVLDDCTITLLGNTTDSNNNSSSNNSTGNTTANSPATSDSMSIPAVAGSAALVLGAVIYVSKKKK